MGFLFSFCFLVATEPFSKKARCCFVRLRLFRYLLHTMVGVAVRTEENVPNSPTPLPGPTHALACVVCPHPSFLCVAVNHAVR